MTYRFVCVIFLILWGAAAFLGEETSTPAIGVFSCFVIAKLEDIDMDIKKLKEEVKNNEASEEV